MPPAQHLLQGETRTRSAPISGTGIGTPFHSNNGERPTAMFFSREYCLLVNSNANVSWKGHQAVAFLQEE